MRSMDVLGYRTTPAELEADMTHYDGGFKIFGVLAKVLIVLTQILLDIAEQKGA